MSTVTKYKWTPKSTGRIDLGIPVGYLQHYNTYECVITEVVLIKHVMPDGREALVFEAADGSWHEAAWKYTPLFDTEADARAAYDNWHKNYCAGVVAKYRDAYERLGKAVAVLAARLGHMDVVREDNT